MLQFIAIATLGAIGFTLYYQQLDKEDAEQLREKHAAEKADDRS